MTFVLDATTRALKITIDAGAGTDVQFVATYADSTNTTFTKGSSQGASNGATAVDVVAAPAASTRRVVKAISFYNANATDPRTVTFYYDDNGTAYTIAKFTLQAGQSWYSETASTEEKGATILDATNRAIKFSIDVAGSDVQYTAAWADSTDTAFTQGSSRGLSNGTSAVTIVGAPAASTRRLVQSITFYNAHASSTRVVTLFYDDNGTARTIAKFSLLAGESWFSEVATFGFQPAGSVYAAPSATAGPPSFRLLALTDLATTTGGGSVVLQTTPTIVTPRINEIRTSTNPFRAVLSFVQVANSANYLQLSNAATGAGLGPILETIGTGTDINFELKSKGFGNIIATTAGLTIKPIDSTVSGALTILGGTGTSAGGQLAIRTNGNNEIVFRTPDNLAASVYYVLPAADGTSGQVLSTNGSGTLSWSNQTTTLSGDVTGSGTTAITTTIANNAVTFAKFQQIATDTLVGRDTASTGNVEAISVTGGIEFSGSSSIRTTAFTGDVTKTAGGTSLTIANDAVTTAKILDANVTLAKIANITSGNLLGRTSGGSGPVQEITPGTGVLTWLQTPTSANLFSALTTKTGTGGNVVFSTAPTITSPTISSGDLTISSGNLNFTNTQTINWDQSKPTFQRLVFRSNATNTNSIPTMLPNGTGSASGLAYIDRDWASPGNAPASYNVGQIIFVQNESFRINSIPVNSPTVKLPILFQTDTVTRIAVEQDGNIGFNGQSYTNGVKVLFIGNASTVPTLDPSGGGILYVTGGALKYRGSSGTVTDIASA